MTPGPATTACRTPPGQYWTSSWRSWRPATLATGLILIALGMLWLTRVPADAGYLTDLLPAFLVAGIGIGLCAPSAQIGALSGVTESASGLASGLVERMREIGAAGVAAESSPPCRPRSSRRQPSTASGPRSP